MKNVLITSNGSFSCEEIVSSLRHEANCLVGTNIYPEHLVGVSHLFDFTCLLPTPNEKNYIPELLKICRQHNIQYIFPLIDVEVDILSQHRDTFLKEGITICLSNPESIRICRDKYLVCQTFLNDTLITPIPTYPYTDIADGSLKNLFTSSAVVAKPYNGRSSQGLLYLTDFYEIETIPDKDKYIFQPKIDGEVFTVDYVQDEYGHDFSIARKEILRTQHGAGLSVEIQQNKTLQKMASHIGKKLQILGAINMEFLFNGEHYYLMDINPRFSAGIAFSHLAGYDIVKNHFLCFQHKPIEDNVTITPCYAVKRYVTYITGSIQ